MWIILSLHLHVTLSFVSIFAEFVSVTYLTGNICDLFHHYGAFDDESDLFLTHPFDYIPLSYPHM